MIQKMIAYCGLDCEKCDAYIATIHHDDALREKTARLWAELNHAPITAEMIHCMGCRTDGAKTPYCESMCEIRQCALRKAVDTCGDCDEMSDCKKVNEILSHSEEARARLTGK